ncbi:MAG: hypothetical protein DHS20C21_09690 [Gemmatimonadota bacterium]|nr:MAG: hypothetical protein DHS20C21_09690 [Gemmatimonadota bacterium]
MTLTAVASSLKSHEPCASGKRKLILLGPQRTSPNLAAVMDAQGIRGKIAVVTAGWQEREEEVEELHHHLRDDTVPLRLHFRAQRAFDADPDLSKRHRKRQAVLRRLQRLYDVRLGHAMAAVTELELRPGDDDVLCESRAEALQAVSDLDREHVARVQAVHDEHESLLDLANREVVQRERHEIGELIGESVALAIAGGHVAVLLNRLRLFDILGLLPETLPVIGWSAGAMVMTERVILYHDSPPQGAGNAEVMETGLGLALNLVALPHAQRRLRLDDPDRVSRFARRMLPARCVILDDGGAVILDQNGWTAETGVRMLTSEGTVREMAT